MHDDESTNPVVEPEPESEQAAQRRGFLVWLSTFGVGAALLASYGTLAAFIGRFLFPARPTERGWMFVTELAGLEAGKSLVYKTPGGAPVNITRKGEGGGVADFVALSSTCPHLGCQVHWESQNDRFFCPCHNGVFDSSGKATEGPPAEAGQSLSEYPLRVSDNMLFIQVPLEQMAGGEGRIEAPGGPTGPGHDPCLYPETSRPAGGGAVRT